MKRSEVTKPSDMSKPNHMILDEICIKFEKEFQHEQKGQDYYHLVIDGEYSRNICDSVEKVYKDAGWKKVTCKTSSENGETPGLTGLRLYTKE
jgi:hypothetical protein